MQTGILKRITRVCRLVIKVTEAIVRFVVEIQPLADTNQTAIQEIYGRPTVVKYVKVDSQKIVQ